MEKVTLKRVLLSLIGLIVALFSLLCLCFSLINLDTRYAFGGNVIEAIKTSENGFKLISGDSQIIKFLANQSKALEEFKAGNESFSYNTYEWMDAFVQTVNICIVILASILVVLTILWFFFDKKKEDLYAIVIVGLVLGALYLVEGIVFTTVTKLELEGIAREYYEIVGVTNNSVTKLSSKDYCTMAYIPFIFIAAAEFAFWMLNGLMKEKQKNAEGSAEGEAVYSAKPSAEKGKATFAATGRGGVVFLENLNENSFEMLKKYKDLYDAGVLTEEEFLQQKQLCLSINSAYAIHNLGLLHNIGLLTDEEYESEKKKLIKSV